MKIYLAILIVFFSSSTFAAKKILVSTSEQDAVIFSNGQKVGTGSATIVVPKKGRTIVTVKKLGFLEMEHIFYDMKGMAKPPKTFYFNLKVDDSYSASEKNDRANVDFAVNIGESTYDDAWRTAVMIVTDYFDVLEISDKETSYLRTAWQYQSFSSNTVRTRIILKSGGEGVIKIKLISEQSGKPDTSIRSDEEFKEWDRVLRKYNNVVSDFQNRLGKQ